MARPALARRKVLEAYIDLLCTDGVGSATMEATAARAGVSKGGLLYHFSSKESLAQAVIDFSEEVIQEDLRLMDEAPEGAATYYVRTSATVNGEFDRQFIAVQRLAQDGNEAAIAHLGTVQQRWYEMLTKHLGDERIANMVMLIGEGLYTHCAMPGGWYQKNLEGQLGELLELIPELKKLGRDN